MTADITSLRIATFNLLHGLDVRSNRVDLDAAAEAIDKLDADVVAVQEVDRGLGRTDELDQVAELAARLDRTGVFAPALLGDRAPRGERRSRRQGPPAGAAQGGLDHPRWQVEVAEQHRRAVAVGASAREPAHGGELAARPPRRDRRRTMRRPGSMRALPTPRGRARAARCRP